MTPGGLVRLFRALRGWSPDVRQCAALMVLIIALAGAAVVGMVGGPGGTGRHVAVPPTPARPSSAAPSSARPDVSSPPQASRPPFRCPPAARRAGGSTPDRICIPSLRVSTSVMSLGLNPDRSVEVPPLSKVGEAGWYRGSAAPGNVGPTVVLGHIDSAQYGEGVFFHLSSLRSGDQVQISRGDGRVAVFRIDRVTEVSKKSFPTDAVYGPTSGPAIRLVTCGGRFDASSGNYEDNIIAFGTLLRLV